MGRERAAVVHQFVLVAIFFVGEEKVGCHLSRKPPLAPRERAPV